jgi:hypothetical protein
MVGRDRQARRGFQQMTVAGHCPDMPDITYEILPRPMRSEGGNVDMIAAAHTPNLGIHSGPKLILLELHECVSVPLEISIHFTVSV